MYENVRIFNSDFVCKSAVPLLVQCAAALLLHVQLSNFLAIKLKTVTPRCLAHSGPQLKCQTLVNHLKYVLAPHCTAIQPTST